MTLQHGRPVERVPDLPADVVDEIEAVLKEVTGSCVATGSLVEGLGNANSDVDVYVIQGADEMSTNPIAIGIRGARYVDCEFMNLRTLHDLAERFDDPSAADLAALQQRDFDRYYRTSVSLHLRVSDEVATVLRRFDRANACRQTARWSRMHAFDRLALAAVAAATGHVHEAVVWARQSSEWRARGVLADACEGYPSPKWTPVKAERRFGVDTPEYHQTVRGMWIRPEELPETLEWLRGEVGEAPSAKVPDPRVGWKLTEGVRVVPHDDGVHLIQGRRSVTSERRLAPILSALGGGRDWARAVRECATTWAVPPREVASAASGVMGALAGDGFVEELST